MFGRATGSSGLSRRWLLLVLALPACRCDDAPSRAAQRPSLPAASGGAPTATERIQRLELQREVAAPLVEALADGEAPLRARATLAAGRMGWSGALPRVIALLGDTDPGVRRASVFALRLLVLDGPVERGKQLAKRASDALLARLAVERDRAVRGELIASLGWTGGPRVAAALTPLLAGADATAALTACGLLGYRKVFVDAPERAVAIARSLTPLLLDAQGERRNLAAWAIYRLGGASEPAVAGALQALAGRQQSEDPDAEQARAWAVRALASVGPSTKPLVGWLLRVALNDPAPIVQVEVVKALARGGTHGAVKLAQALGPLWRGIGQSHYRLTGMRLQPMLAGLEALAPHAKVPTIQRIAEELLDASDARESVVRYAPVEAHAMDLVHCAAARLRDLGLGRLDRSPTCGTARAKTLGAAWRRASVAETIGLARRPGEWKLTMLRRYLGDESPRVRATAALALGEIDEPLVQVPLLRLVKDADPAVFGAACEVVARRAGPEDGREIGALVTQRLQRLNLVVEPEAACQAVKALGKLGVALPAELAQRLASSASWAVRACVERVLHIASEPRPLSRGLPDLAWAAKAPLPTKAVLVTEKGEIFLELLADEAPATVASFARLASKRFYRGLTFHRVVPGFVAQGGDPRGDGYGGPGYTLPCELTPRPYRRGSVGMALAGRDSGGSQFFITLSRQPHLDGRYTQFARVTGGMDVVDRLHPEERIKDLYIPQPAKK